MRKFADSRHRASPRRLVLVSLCALSLGAAFFACLNPRPEDYPSENDSPSDRAFAPGDGNRQGPGLEESTATGETTSAPEEPAPEGAAPQPPSPSGIAPGEIDAGADAGADPGADAGVSDAGVVSSSAD